MMRDERWVEVSRSEFAHEAEGLRLLKYVVPDASPYRGWTNFEFMDSNGQWHEVDALVLGRRRLHLVELKAYTGIITSGNEQSWTILSMGAVQRTQRSPLLLARRKAQRLASRIEDEARKVALEHGLAWDKVRARLPFIQECVFLHGSPFSSKLSGLAATGLFGPDGREDETGLPGISQRLLEPPTDNRRIDEDLGIIIALALRGLGVARRTERRAGSWTISGHPLAAGDDWQQFRAANNISGEEVLARVVSLRPGTPTQARAAAYRRVQREYTLLSSLHHESIVAPRDLVQDEDGNTVLVYPATPGFEPLDLVLADRQLTIEQQVEILVKAAEALAYAHRNHVAHRGLGPSAVLINTCDLAAGSINIRLVDWSFAGRVHTTATSSGTMHGALTNGSPAEVDDVYQAPEDRWSPDADRTALDLFSVGALAYFLLSGGQAPASGRSGLLERLRRENGLDLAAAGGQFVGEPLRELVLAATRPNVSKRLERHPKSGEPTFGVQQFANALTAYGRTSAAAAVPDVDPLNPAIEDVIDGRFEVTKVLGSGSTARGILVADAADDHHLRVLKVGLDDAASGRLREEAEVLTQLGGGPQKVPGVVELIEGPLELGAGRTALLLSNCGEKTLADIIRYTALPETQLRSLGAELLDIVAGLDAAGMTHRDIKPANLGLQRPEGKRAAATHLALFDFSLARVPVDNLTAGTPPYRDPFLGEGLRNVYDSAAERYSAAVVLYEMATNTTPVYGDSESAPASLTDDISVTSADFTANGYSDARAIALADFFRRALARDVKARFDTADGMRQAWAAVFAAAALKAPIPVPAALPTAPIPAARGDGAEPQAYRPLAALLTQLTAAAGGRPSVTRRQLVELVLGTHPASPEDPFTTYPALAAAAQVTTGRVAQVFGEFPALWQKNATLATTVTWLHEQLLRQLAAWGGVSTPDLVAREWTANLLDTDGVEHPHRSALGLVRLVLASAPSSPRSEAVTMVRSHGTGTVAMIAAAGIARQLPAVLADKLEVQLTAARDQGADLVTPSDFESRLRAAAAKTLRIPDSDLQIASSTLAQIGAAASTDVALSARGELHARDMSIGAALRAVLHGVSADDTLTRPELESRVKARFPALSPALPRRPDLDALVHAAVPGISWDEEHRRYAFTESVGMSGVPSYHTRIPAAHTFSDRQHGISDAERLLRASLSDASYRGLGVPLGLSDNVAADLVAAFGATHIDVTEFVLRRLQAMARQEGLPWQEVLAADAGTPADQAELKDMVAQVIPDLVDAINAAPGPVVLTDLSTLAAYGQLSVLHTWADISGPPPHAVWSLIPQPDESGGGPGARVDSEAFPRTSPEQFVQLGAEDLGRLRQLAVQNVETVSEGERV